MKCNPLRWLFGLLPLLLIWWIALLGTTERIEADLRQRAREHLDRNGLQWANVQFKARDALITGRAEEESEQRRPSQEAAKVWGVRTFEDRIDVLQLVRNYVWTATIKGGQLVLDGHVPNEAARKAILAAARSSLPKLKVDDKLDLARGAPEQKVFIGATQFALAQLANLKPGAVVRLEGAAYSVQGEAETTRGYEQVRTALSRAMPAGISLKSERVLPPAVSPYTWSAALRQKRIELSGHAPSIPARDAIKAAAERAIPGGQVVDRMTLASGAPGDWQKVAASALARLGQLTQGMAEMVDTQLTVAGYTNTEPEAAAVRRALRSDMPQSIRLTERIIQDPAAKAAEDARRAAEEAAKKAAAEAEAKRVAAAAEARRIAELERQIGDQQARQRAEEEAQRQRLAQDEAQRRKQQDEANRKATAEAEAARRAAEERTRAEAAVKAEAARKAAEEKAKAEAAAKARVAEAQRCQTSMSTVVENGVILFARASADIDRSSYKTLDELARIIKACPGFVVEVAGHTDSEGVPERNQRWSDLRANAVRTYMLKAGVPADTLIAVGYGQTQPKVPNDSPANMAKNRRIEFNVKNR